MQLGSFIENQSQHFPSYKDIESKTEYHALTRGLIINEIVRSIDPMGRTMSEILKEDIKIDGILIGAKNEELGKCVSYSPISLTFILQQILAPWWYGKKIDLTLGQAINTVIYFASRISGSTPRPKTFEELNSHSIADFYKSTDFVKAEVSSAGIQANARGCAKLASIMANEGLNLMSKKSWKIMHSEPKSAIFGDMPDGRLRCNFTIGGANYFKNFDDATWIESEKFNKNREGFYGWFGLGGSIVQWHPELQIGFAFIPTFLNVPDLLNSRGGVLQQIVKDCV